MNVVSTIGVKPATPSKPGDLKKDLEISLSLVEGGAGALVGGAESVATPELAPEPVPDEKIWRYVLSGFETGQASVPIPEGEVHPIVDAIKGDVEDTKKHLQSIQPYLEAAGIKQEFKLDFYVEGYASRRWTGAGTNDALRQEKNLRLSTERAQNVAAALYAAFGPDHVYTPVGKGAAVWLPGGRFGTVTPENDEERIQQLLRQREEQIRRENPEFSPEQIRQMVEEYRKGILQQNRPTSNVDLARRVNITVTWRGFDVRWKQNASPAPHTP
jgi:hypothetical protein